MSTPHLAVALDGVGWHPASWREDTDSAHRLTDPTYWVALAKQAEAGGSANDFLILPGATSALVS